MTETHNRSVAPMGEDACRAVGSVQWLLEKKEDAHAPPYHANLLKHFICGKEAFEKIAEDIRKAKGSVEIICWGFDPAMELERTGSVWPRGETWGGLLKDVAEGRYNGGKPVQVRLLAWHGLIGGTATNNLPGYGQPAPYETRQASVYGMERGGMSGGMDGLPPPTDPRDRREVFNANWYREASGSRLKNLSIRTRDGDSAAVRESLREEPGTRDRLETAGMVRLATDHQKTILIDYEHEGGRNAVGYVMGLNFITDYWDTKEHLFDDPRRGASWEGHGDDGPGLKPYQDYACRIQGEALVAVSKNFTDAWNRAKGRGESLARAHDLRKPPPGLSANLEGTARHRAQIVRTQPEEKDKTIKRLYRQASSFARNYVYVENQYFQYTEWAQQLKEERASFLRQAKAGGCSAEEIPNLHVMVVIPTPEKTAMVPRTYDTVKSLGHADSMPDQDKQIEDELVKAREAQRGRQGVHLSAVAESAVAVGSKQEVLKELDTLGIRTLVASLHTFNHNWRTTQKKQLDKVEALKGNPDQAERYKKKLEKLLSERYREIYTHSKLMIIDDAMFTLGSANLNLRSMAVDAEINVASDDAGFAKTLLNRQSNISQ